ncbi:ATP-binding protein [Pseudomonas aeruginosa]|uniref:ATP-binding protein n=1 Tax=Pseudomonas aeruginosa TaxID=287 RepID=UPI00070CA3DB|nr:ATP-binding protein [Pseudomonas aeruginosa]KAA5622713.1 ATP-binding protein [Pseudomonas aeruginosa]MBI7196577.1 ATP-binding protein [Pseudomonas aeruginosa]MBX6272956.1 ATP-binding protein [Pseudomonas aeruginosa]WBM19989.1 ATP-binding protein [Pseudomonas aeruginosa]
MEDLNFKISSHLKSVIGRDLITDDFVAIFELVKNSFDANASEVDIYFGDDQITIVDNGKGMSESDIKNKWLFVAYSAKSDGTEDSPAADTDYRENIQHRRYAGSKGVGRFSCDRLGSKLFLQSRKSKTGDVQQLIVNWLNFEESAKENFIDIPVQYGVAKSFQSDSSIGHPNHGTILEITDLRSSWPRESIKELKASLAKLINPFGATTEGFTINIHAPAELERDEELRKREITTPNEIINGPVENFIFQTLQDKTTWLRSWIAPDENRFYTELIDRQKLIYRISEENPYPELTDTNFECNIFYLNRAAKLTFARNMGISSVKFGSIFLFKNGFRSYPIGEENDDTFGIDRRKQQGYARYLGTRDVLGRIDVYGDEKKFKESSSRDKGLIESKAYLELVDSFWDRCFLRLENYVVGVSWRLKYDMDLEDASFLTGDEARSKVIEVVAKLANTPTVKVESYSEDILTVIDSKVKGFDKAIQSLENLAIKIGNTELANKAKSAAQNYEEMRRAEAEALTFAENEQKARKAAEAASVQKDAELRIERQRNLFLLSQGSRDKDILENLHHQVMIYASNAVHCIEKNLILINGGRTLTADEVKAEFEQLLLLNQQVIAASRFATTANFMLESSQIETDLGGYIYEYITKVCPIHEGNIDIIADNRVKNFKLKFSPIEISIIVDNLINNAYKAGAGHITFSLSQEDVHSIKILVNDNGGGVPSEIQPPERIFEKGVTTTSGSGLGLYHVRQLLESMQGSISLHDTNEYGCEFLIRIYK